MLVVTGAAGFLGSNVIGAAVADGRCVAAVVHHRVPGSSESRALTVDLTKPDAAAKLIDALAPTAVVNCAALASVDECERNPHRAVQLNAAVPEMLALACGRAGIAFAHVSTDSVFDGKRGQYKESDATGPLNAYAASKLDGEKRVQATMPEALIIRTNFIGISPGQGTGLADWIADGLEAGERITGFKDVVFSPLFAGTLGSLILKMIDEKLTGVYHLGSSDSVSKYELARRIAAALGLDSSLIDADVLADAGLNAPRPLDTSLDSSKARAALGITLPTVQDAVDAFAKVRRSRNVLPSAANFPT